VAKGNSLNSFFMGINALAPSQNKTREGVPALIAIAARIRDVRPVEMTVFHSRKRLTLVG
jgi:hypothetical protein